MKKINILGIDPGKEGGLVLLGPEGNILGKEVMPIGEDQCLDKLGIMDLFFEWWTWDEFHVYMERVIPFALNAKGALNFGRQLGMLEFIFWKYAYPATFVEAAKWSKEIHQGIDSNLKPKAKSQIATERLFPGQDLRATEKSKKPHEGIVDALLIAEYGRRMLKK